MDSKVAIGADSSYLALKREIIEYLAGKSVQIVDVSAENSDYTDCAEAVASAVLNGSAETGVLIGETGVEMSIAANKVPGIRCAVCAHHYQVLMCRGKDNCNVLAVGACNTGREVVKELIDAFVNTEFERGEEKYERRVRGIREIEEKYAGK